MRGDETVQKSKPSDDWSADGRELYIFGWWTGMGALIHSTVNAIWLASKLGFEPRIWWGTKSLYSRSAYPGDCYRLLFKPSITFGEELCQLGSDVYPKELVDVGAKIPFGAAEVEVSARLGSSSWRVEDREVIRSARSAVLFQYLGDDVALKLAHGNASRMRAKEMARECNALFAQYFSPADRLRIRACKTARALWDAEKPIVGVHVRATDKMSEKAVPCPQRMAREAATVAKAIGADTIFIASDSVKALEACKAVLEPSIRVVCQDIRRGYGAKGIHFERAAAFENGEDMVVDIELLSMCTRVVAFPGSQIHWWLCRRLGHGEGSHRIVDVNTTVYDWAVFARERLRAGSLRKYLEDQLRTVWRRLRSRAQEYRES